jgi:xylulose-5-phosphate/fructose-6-phosphate phosphoketolase
MLPNPPPDPSQLPESVLDLRVKLQNIQGSLSDEELQAIDGFKRVANYMAAAMIYLQKNTLLESPLSKEDIKPRLLGTSFRHSRHNFGPDLILRYN